MLKKEIENYYKCGKERKRLFNGCAELERIRMLDIFHRYLPKAPATILDIGGGAGVYAFSLAKENYAVTLIDPMPLHIQQAMSIAKKLHSSVKIVQGDARQVNEKDNSVDVVLLLGPLYHLTAKEDRLQALKEAYRVLKPEGLIFAAGISCFASLITSIPKGLILNKDFSEIIKEDLNTGQHRNPKNKFHYFTTAFFHHPQQLKSEVIESGFCSVTLLGIEGPMLNIPEHRKIWHNPAVRKRILSFLRTIETDESIIGASCHILAIGQK